MATIQSDVDYLVWYHEATNRYFMHRRIPGSRSWTGLTPGYVVDQSILENTIGKNNFVPLVERLDF